MRLIESVSESLQAEMRENRAEVREVKDVLHRIEVRLDRLGGMVNGGARVLTRLGTWSESVDEMLAERDQKFEELTRRVEQLEKRQPPLRP
jgi:chromosome segregation ATPase